MKNDQDDVGNNFESGHGVGESQRFQESLRVGYGVAVWFVQYDPDPLLNEIVEFKESDGGSEGRRSDGIFP